MIPVAYYNSELINRDELSIDISDLGFILGTTISERLRTFGGQLFELDAHPMLCIVALALANKV